MNKILLIIGIYILIGFTTGTACLYITYDVDCKKKNRDAMDDSNIHYFINRIGGSPAVILFFIFGPILIFITFVDLFVCERFIPWIFKLINLIGSRFTRRN